MQCAICGSERTKKCGLQRGHQRYKCKECGRKFQGLEYRPEDVAFNKYLGRIAYNPKHDTPDVAFEPKSTTLCDNADLLLQIDKRYSPEELRAIAAGHGTLKPRSSKPIEFDGERIKVLVITDTHWGSQYVNDAWYDAAIAEGKREHVSELWHAGDVTEGMSGRDGHIYELKAAGYKAQRDLAVRRLLLAEMPIKAISGNHDLWYMSKANMGGDIVEDICSRVPEAEYLGPQEADILVNGIRVRLFHGEDASSYAISYRPQKIVESFSGGEKPAVLICGHDHKALSGLFIRNIHTMLAGCLQAQTPWMRRKKIAAMPGFHILEMCIANREIKWFNPRFYPFYS
jgi:predicted phosphodiesterase